jgi:hypothetical protein
MYLVAGLVLSIYTMETTLVLVSKRLTTNLGQILNVISITGSWDDSCQMKRQAAHRHPA